MAERLFMIDGHALVFKMHYAFYGRPMVNSKGVDTSILFGFMKYLLELVEREKPDRLVVAFDPPGGTFRNRLYPDYKANRPPTPQLVIDALEPLTRMCTLMNIPVLTIRDYEADDVIGTLARRASAEGLVSYMVTPDKDYGQLVGDDVFQYKPGRNGGENEVIGKKEVCDKYNIREPAQVIDMLAICGDAADNVPGVKGVGEVGAGKLISGYGSLENIYAHLDELPAKQAALFEAAKDHIALSKELVTIKTDVPFELDMEKTRWNPDFQSGLRDVFVDYEFRSLLKYLPRDSAGPSKRGCGDGADFGFANSSPEKVLAAGRKTGALAFALGSGKAAVSARGEDGKVLASECGMDEWGDVAADEGVLKYGHDIKRSVREMEQYGSGIEGEWRDLELMHYILDPEKSHKLEDLAQQYAGVGLEAAGDEGGLSLFDDGPGEDLGRRAAIVLVVGEKLYEALSEGGWLSLYNDMEAPLSRVLARMEKNGVKVDIGSLHEFAGMLRGEITDREKLVRGIAGNQSLNLSSPKQLGELIYEQLKLDPSAKKGRKTSWPTDEATLTEMEDRSPVIPAILEYRAAKKLLSTYIEPFPSYVSPVDGRVHTTFNQALTATGRLSSSNPNLQNIPVRTERGRLIRKAFTSPDESHVIMSADYSQIELRVMAHLCGDENMCEAFRTGVDVHSAMASKIFGVNVDEVSSEQRRKAKTANFGIMYGISSFGLAQRLKVPRAEAKKLIDDYFASFPAISLFIEDVLRSARQRGYVETIFGRRRYVPDLRSSNANIRAVAERNAVNAPIQGSAADIMKLAMIAVDRRMSSLGLASRMVLQIHDELVFEVPLEEMDVMKKLVVEEMEGAVRLNIPLTVECNEGKNWLEAH